MKTDVTALNTLIKNKNDHLSLKYLSWREELKQNIIGPIKIWNFDSDLNTNKLNTFKAHVTNLKNNSVNTSSLWAQEHPFHLVDPSPWPILTSLVSYQAAVSLLIVFHNIKTLHLPYINFIYSFLPSDYKLIYISLVENGIIAVYGMFPLILATLMGLFFVLICWFNDIVTEATYLGEHTKAVQKNILFGFALFISSEVMFFFGFFWAYFHMALNPAVSIGCTWPPLGIEVLDIWELPFLNTVILLSSGVSVTLAHRAITMPVTLDTFLKKDATFTWQNFPRVLNLKENIVNKNNKYKNITTFALSLTILYGLIFSGIQWYEYENAPFALNDSVYGSLFFILTGFHGFHVCIGILFLFVCLLRNIKDHFSPRHHIGFICAAWYWHFVDVVWLFLFIVVYWWGS